MKNKIFKLANEISHIDSGLGQELTQIGRLASSDILASKSVEMGLASEYISRFAAGEKLWTPEEWKTYKKKHPHTDIKPKFNKTEKVEKAPKKETAPKEEAPSSKTNTDDYSKVPSLNSGEKAFSDDDWKKPSKQHQPSVGKDKEALKAQATEAQEMMMTFLDKGKGMDSKLGAHHIDVSKVDFKGGETMELDKKQGPVVITAPMKDLDGRGEEKVRTKYEGNWDRLTDVVRATIAVDTHDQVQGVIKSLKANGMEIATMPEDRFETPTDAGYRDVKLNVKYPNGHIGELQINTKAMMAAKDKGHKLYEEQRTLEGIASEKGDEALSDEDWARIEKLKEDQKKIYSVGWEQSQGKTASVEAIASTEKVAGKTKYYRWGGSPAVWEHKKWPYSLVNGKKVIQYDFEDFFTNAQEIDKKKFEQIKAEDAA